MPTSMTSMFSSDSSTPIVPPPLRDAWAACEEEYKSSQSRAKTPRRKVPRCPPSRVTENAENTEVWSSIGCQPVFNAEAQRLTKSRHCERSEAISPSSHLTGYTG